MRRLQHVFTAFRVAILVLVLIVIAVLLYLHLVGFPLFVQNWVKRELARNNIAAQWSSLRFELLEGLVAREAVFREANEPYHKLAEAEEVAIHLRPLQLVRGAEAISGITITRAHVELPNLERFVAEDAYARVRFPQRGVVEIQQLSGLYAGIRLNISGIMKIPPKLPSPPLLTAPRDSRPESPRRNGWGDIQDSSVLQQISRELRSLRFNPAVPPEITVRFRVDLTRWREAQFDLRVRGKDLGYEGEDGRSLYIDELDAQCTVSEEALHVSRLRGRLYGGEIVTTRPCMYDLAQGRVYAAVRSTTDVKKLAPFLPPGARRALAELEFTSNPRLSVEFEFSENTGTRPTVRAGFAEVVNFKYRTIPVKYFRGYWTMSGGYFHLTRGDAVTADGAVNGEYRVNLDTSDFEARLEGKLLPPTIYPLLNEKQTEFMSQFIFDEPAQASKVFIRGNWHYPAGTRIEARLDVGRWRTRGIANRGLTTDVVWENETLTFSDTILRRDDGTVTGGFFLDTRRGDLRLNAQGSVFPQPLLEALWPEARKLWEPYEIEKPPRFDLKARLNLRDLDTMDIEGRAWVGRSKVRGIPVEAAEGVFHYRAGIVDVPDFTVQRKEGRVVGALTWDVQRQELRGDIISTVNANEVLPVFGPRVVEAMKPYAFRSAPLISAYGVLNFADPSATEVNAFITGCDFTLTVPREKKMSPQPAAADIVEIKQERPIFLEADTISGELIYRNNVLQLNNLDAAMYGGLVRGWGEFTFGGPSVSYRGELIVDKTDLAKSLRAFWNKEGNYSGILSGHAKFTEGNFGDLNSLKSVAYVQINDGHLVDVPIFGLASFILNMLPGKLGNERARTATGNLEAANGRITTRDAVVETVNSRTSLKGSITWDGDLSFKVTTRGKGIGVLLDPLRWLTDVEVTGKFDKPEVRPSRLP